MLYNIFCRTFAPQFGNGARHKTGVCKSLRSPSAARLHKIKYNGLNKWPSAQKKFVLVTWRLQKNINWNKRPRKKCRVPSVGRQMKKERDYIMKKIVLSAALLMGVAAASATTRDVDRNLELNVNIDKLSVYLALDAQQAELTERYAAEFSDQLHYAKYAKKSERRARKVQRAVYTNLGQMRQTLTKEQYGKYLRLMNVTLRNRGLDTYMAAL